MENNENCKWYVIHVFSSYETVVQNNLESMIENNNLQDYIAEISVPKEEVVVEKNGKRKVVERKKFPSYVFLKMICTDHIRYMVSNTRGVTGFVGPQGKALPLTADEVRRMGLEKVSAEEFDIAVGDNVKIINGPLETFLGVVDEVSMEKQKARVIVHMFGRQTPIELEFSQIEKL